MDKYLIVLEKSSTGFSAYSPDVCGCITTGETLEETRSNMQSALSFHIQAITNDEETIPQPRGIQSYLEALENSEGEEFFITYINVQSVLPELVAA
ncbi:MAG: type II toxin-antitoxin system HicB family antitoxin [Pseudanabaena sp. ELA645]|jgi:predicted RNase H-like HicB family nuclease